MIKTGEIIGTISKQGTAHKNTNPAFTKAREIYCSAVNEISADFNALVDLRRL